MSLFDRLASNARSVRTLVESGALAPMAPDRIVRVGGAVRHWGPTLASAFAVAGARYGNRAAVVADDGHATFAQLDHRTDAAAAGLVDRYAEHSVVGVLGRNSLAMVETIGATAKAGRDIVFLNTGFSAAQLGTVCAREKVTMIVHDAEFSEAVRGLDIVACEMHDTLHDLTGTYLGHRPQRSQPAGRIVILTSGTTGTPKGANRPATTSLSAAAAMLESIPYRAGETMLIAAPLFHSWGFANLVTGLMLGNTILPQGQFQAAATLDAMATHDVAVLVAVPVMLNRLLEVPEPDRRGLSFDALRVVPLSGSAIPAGLAERFMDTFGDVVYNLYGSTEAGSVAVAAPADLRAAPGTAGRPPRGTEIRILDEAGNDVALGGRGTIHVRSDLLFDGYTDGATKPSHEGYMSTGDTGHIDAEGRLFVEGRDDDMIVSGGENVFPSEVEDVIAVLPGVRDVVVVGVPDHEFGSRLRAFVVADTERVTAEQIRDHVKHKLARFKVPRDIEFLDALPRNETGKILRRQLPPS